MTPEEIKAAQDEHPELFAHLKSQGHGDEKAAQILVNHRDAVQAEFDEKDSDEPVSAAPDLAAIRDYLREHIEALEQTYGRLVDHVNRELGVAQDVSLVDRVTALESRVQLLQAQKVSDPTTAPAAQGA